MTVMSVKRKAPRRRLEGSPTGMVTVGGSRVWSDPGLAVMLCEGTGNAVSTNIDFGDIPWVCGDYVRLDEAPTPSMMCWYLSFSRCDEHTEQPRVYSSPQLQSGRTSRLAPPKGEGLMPCRAGGEPVSGEPPKSLLQSESRRGVVTCMPDAPFHKHLVRHWSCISLMALLPLAIA